MCLMIPYFILLKQKNEANTANCIAALHYKIPRRPCACTWVNEGYCKTLIEDGSDEFLRVEALEVVCLFAYTDIPDRYIKFIGNGYNDASLGRAVHLGKYDACRLANLLEFSDL